MTKEYSMTEGAFRARERRAKDPDKSRKQSLSQYYKRKEKTPFEFMREKSQSYSLK